MTSYSWLPFRQLRTGEKEALKQTSYFSKRTHQASSFPSLIQRRFFRHRSWSQSQQDYTSIKILGKNFAWCHNHSRYCRILGDPSVDTGVVYLRWADIDTKVLGTLLQVHCCVPHSRKWNALVIFYKSSPGNVKKKRVIIQMQAKF